MMDTDKGNIKGAYNVKDHTPFIDQAALDPTWITPLDAARQIGVNRTELYRLLREKRIRSIIEPTTGRKLVAREDVILFHFRNR